ncbi:MAG: hypothetical protein NZM25_10760 [Leptospiraceae bacterium]|nr:hypothetical protein [Leptospiraceae bacterium]MDW8305909.1 hypothetical protein [Leptospiraceae bacterium]
MKKYFIVLIALSSITIASLLLADITLLPLILFQLKHGEFFSFVLASLVMLWFALRLYLNAKRKPLLTQKHFFLRFAHAALETLKESFWGFVKLIKIFLIFLLYGGFLTAIFLLHEHLLN